MSAPWRRLCLPAAALAVAAAAGAQVPEIAYVFPAGIRRGTTVEVTVGGRDLQGVTGARFAAPGLTAEVIEKTRPMTSRERATAQEKLEELQQKRREGKLTPAEEATARELRQKIAESRRQVSPQLVETAVLRVTAAADVPAGGHDLRLVDQDGLSNPLRFVVGDLPERTDADAEGADAGTVPMPAVINGRILARDVDRFRIRVARGQQLVAVVEARSLIPFVADAVPGWFQAYLTLRSADGRVLHTVDDCGSDPDPVLHWVVEGDGVCQLEIGDALCRGREDFVYRLTIGELPHVTSVFPLGATAGQRTRAVLRGANLASMLTEVDLTGKQPGVVTIDPSGAGLDQLPFAVDRCPEVREVEPNEDTPQELAAPVIVNGIIEQPEDVDVFTIKAPTGTRLVAEVTARRLGSPLDSLLRLVDPEGREVERSDDEAATASGLDTHAADSRIAFRIGQSGVYRLLVSDVQQKGSPDHAYRLYVGPPRPDFGVRVAPSAIALRSGGTAVVGVHVARRDGFDGPVVVELLDAPPGFELGGALVPAGVDRIDITVTAGAVSPGAVVPLLFTGRARLGSGELRRAAVPCDDRMQAFAYRHLVPAEQFLCLGRAGRVPIPVERAGKGALRMRVGGTSQFGFSWVSRRDRREVEFTLRDPPTGVTIAEVEKKARGYVLHLAVERRDELRGLAGNLIVDVRLAPGGGGEGGRGRAARVVDTLPAIPFQIAR